MSDKASEFTVDVLANCEWSFSIDVDWIYVIEPRSQYTGSRTLTIRVFKNETTSIRVGKLVFRFAGEQTELKISQEPFEVYLTVSEDNLSFGYRTAEKELIISSNCGWEAKSSVDWVAIRPSTGLVGSFDMVVNVETNNSKEARLAEVLIWNERYQLNKTIRISQIGQSEIIDKD